MKQKWWGLVALIGLLVVTLVLMLTGWQPSHAKQRPIRVVTSLNFYGEVAQSVAGKYGEVTSFINNEAVDTHDFQPSTKQAQELAKANVVVENGLGYDAWLPQMVKATEGDQTVINVGRSVAHKQPGDNEHVWYEPQTMGRLALTLADRYSQLDPAHADYYHRRARQYQASLAPLNQTIREAKANVQSHRRQVLVSEPVFDYALHNLGYEIANPKFAKAVEDGNDPSPQEIKGMQDDLQHGRVAFFVNNRQETSATVRTMLQLANQHDVPVLNVTETKPAQQTYVQWMQHQYEALIRIQQRGE